MIGIETGLVAPFCNECNQYIEQMKSNINDIKFISCEVADIFKQNDMGNIVRQMDNINGNYDKIINTLSNYLDVIKSVDNSYSLQAEEVSTSFTNSNIDII